MTTKSKELMADLFNLKGMLLVQILLFLFHLILLLFLSLLGELKTLNNLSFREAKLCCQFGSFHADEVLISMEFFLEASQLFAGKHGPCSLWAVKVKRPWKHQFFELTARIYTK